MSTLEPTLPQASDESTLARSLAPGRAVWLAECLERAGEWLNPILVKECRQALKSRQFVLTFALLLAGGWLWSLVGISMVGPNAYYTFTGPDMFFGYFLVLAFPVLVIVPYMAFRSLAAEWDDRTFELVSITTLGPRQIIAGKLGSAVAQMIVYFSAVSPCLAFTYLLRGIDVVTIAFVIVYLFLASLALSVTALLVSTLAREKHWQIVLSIGLIVVLLYLFVMSTILTTEILGGWVLAIDNSEFWVAHAAIATAYVSTFVMLFLAAAAQLTFPSENRSTPLRITMLVQFALFTGWMVGLGANAFGSSAAHVDPGIVVAFVLLAGLYWYGMGVMMVQERPDLSARVKRRLPQSFLGRVFLTWFSPGPGTGYLFAVSNLLVAAAVGIASLVWFNANGQIPIPGHISRSVPSVDQTLAFIVLGVSYAIFYLGIGKLVLRFLQPLLSAGFIPGLAVQLLLLMLGTGIPLIILGFSRERSRGYSLLQLTNPFWTLYESIERHPVWSDIEIAFYLLPLMAAVVFVLNLPSLLREVRHTRIAAPPRVLEDEAIARAQARDCAN